jgi:hypothetical protein
MKPFATFLLVYLALTSNLLAQVTLSPAAPRTGEAFDIRVEGTWRDSCVPANPRLFIADKKLIATFALSGGGGCFSAVSAFSATIHVPGLATGSYQLSARVLDYDGPRKFFEKTIQITGAPSGVTSISSAFDTSAGNRVVKIRGSFPCTATGCTRVRIEVRHQIAAPADLGLRCTGGQENDEVQRDSGFHRRSPISYAMISFAMPASG